MSNPVKEFSLSCSGKGDFYICEETPNRFIGCCTSNPCHTSDGICPDDDLGPTTFDESSFDDIPAQDCAGNDTDVHWYTCAATSPPFMGCCAVNPCAEGGCPTEALRSSRLSDKSENAKPFLSSDSTSTSTETSTSTSTSTGSATSDSNNDDGSSGLSHGAVAGIAAGGAVIGVILIGCLIFWVMKRTRKNRPTSDKSAVYEPFGGQHLSFQESKFSSPQYTPNTPNFPPNVQQPYYSPQQIQQPQQSPQFYAVPAQGPPSAGLSMSPYNSNTASPTRAQFRDSMATTAELPSSPRAGNGFAQMPSVSVTSYSGVGRENQVSGLTTGPHAQQPVELEETTRWLLRNDR